MSKKGHQWKYLRYFCFRFGEPWSFPSRESLKRVFPLSSNIVAMLAVILLSSCANPEREHQERMELVQEALDLGLIDTASAELAGVPPEFQSRTEVLAARAEIAEAEGRAEEAGELFLELADRDPGDETLLRRAFENFLEADARSRALAVLPRFLGDEDKALWKVKAELHEAGEEYRPALDAYLHLRRIGAEDEIEDLPLRIGRLFKWLDNPARAEDFLAEAKEAPDPEIRREAALLHLAVVYQRERWEESLELLEKLDRDYPGALEGSPWAPIRGELEKWQEAREEAARAAEEPLLDEDPEAEDPEEAAEPEPATDPDPQEEEPIEEPGEAVATEAAVTDTEEAPPEETEEEPSRKLDVEEEELPPLEPEIEEPEVETARDRAARLVDESRYDEAIALYWELLTDQIDDQDLWFGISKAFYGNQAYRDAEMAAREALRRDRENLRYVLNYLQAVQANRSPERFMQELTDAYRRFPDSPDILLALARAYTTVVVNDRNAALFYRRFLERAPNHPEAGEAREELLRLGFD